MKVTDKNYSLDKKLVSKLDLMVERVVNHKFDNLIIIDGREGFGKSNLASAISYYLAWKSGRAFSMNNVFFLIDDMINFAVHSKEQIIWWDEAALGGLASESYNKIQTKLLKLLMIARKKQHFYVFCIPKYFKLREGVVDRSIALVHTYSRDEVSRGRFAYYGSEKLERMYEYWRHTKDKGYKRFWSFLGTFSETLPLILDENEYEKRKDAAIMTLGETDADKNREKTKFREEIARLRGLYASLNKTEGIEQKKLARYAGITPRTLQIWAKTAKLAPMEQKNEDERTNTIIINEVTTDDGDEDETSIPISKGAGDE